MPNRCSRCGKIGHNKNNTKFHSLQDKKKESPSKKDPCTNTSDKQPLWCKERRFK